MPSVTLGSQVVLLPGSAWLKAAGKPAWPVCLSGTQWVCDCEIGTFAVRLTPEQDALIRRAAEVEGTDLTAFTLCATMAHARDVLADRRHFLLDDAAWTEFNAHLDQPIQCKPALATLFAKPSLFDTDE